MSVPAQSLVWIWALCACGATTGVVDLQAGQATPASIPDGMPEDPGYAKLSAKDKAMLQQEADQSYFTGAMSSKEKAFAREQGAQKAMFGMSEQEKHLAQDQSRVWLSKDGQDTLQYLTTADHVSGQDMKALADVQKTASENAERLQKELRDMNAREKPRQSHDLLRTLDDIDDQIGYEEETQDLGEGADLSAQEDPAIKEKIKKAKEKAKVKMDAANKRQTEEVKSLKTNMKETIKKADQVRMEAVKKAQRIVPDALSEYDNGEEQKRKAAKEKMLDLKDSAQAGFRKAEARNLETKQRAALAYTSTINEAAAKKSKVHMEAEEWYEKKLGALENKNTEGAAEARQKLVKAKAEIERERQKAREESQNRAEQLKTKFDLMGSEIDSRTNTMIEKLANAKTQSKRAAEKQFKDAKGKASKKVSSLNLHHSKVQEKAASLLSESRDDDSKAMRYSDEIAKTKMEYKEQEMARKDKMKKRMSVVLSEANNFDLSVQKKRKEVLQKEKVRDEAEAHRGSMSKDEYKKRQMKWLNMVKTNANKNCDDAKRESILRTRGSRIANLRLSRMSHDMLFMKKKVLEDIRAKGSKAFDMKEKASKHLKKVVADQAAAMKQSDKSYDASEVQKAALEFSKVAGPEKSQEERIKEATEKVKEAQKSADDHSDAWAKAQNLKTAENLKQTADRVCHKEQHKYETVKFRVRKRLGLASEHEHKALAKGQFQDKKWALRQVSVMLGKKKKITEAGEKKKSKLSQEEQRVQLGEERKEKSKINNFKEKSRKLKESSKRKQTIATSTTKEETASQSAQLKESESLMEVSERTHKKLLKTAEKKFDEGKERLLGEAKAEHTKLASRRQRAMESIRLGESTGSRAALERAQKKSAEMIAKTGDTHKELITKATKKRDNEVKDINQKTEQERGKAKTTLEDAKLNARKRLAHAKDVLNNKLSQAGIIEQEASSRDEGARNSVQFEAQTKAQSLLNKSRQAQQEAIKAAKENFVQRVKDVTAKQMEKIKEIKANVLSSFAPSELTASVLLQLSESSTEHHHSPAQSSAREEMNSLLQYLRASEEQLRKRAQRAIRDAL